MIKDHARMRALREANKVFRTPEPRTAMTDYAKAQQSLQENRERLKAQRLARDVEGELSSESSRAAPKGGPVSR